MPWASMICISASVRQRVMSALIGGSLRNKCPSVLLLGGIVNKLIHHPKWMLFVYIIFAYVKCTFEALCASCHEKVAWTIDMSSFLNNYNHVWDSLLVRFTWYLSILSNFLLRVLSRETRHFFMLSNATTAVRWRRPDPSFTTCIYWWPAWR